MVAALLTTLIYIALVVGIFYLIIWFCEQVLEIGLPPKVVKIGWVIVVLVVILILWNLLSGYIPVHGGRL